MKFSVIVPAWNEGPFIGHGFKRLREVSEDASLEVILVDGGSTDRTVEEARPWVDRVLEHGSPNRGAQLHAGARAAMGDMLLFLHADAQLPARWHETLERFWLGCRPEPAATVFSVDYGPSWAYRLVAGAQNLRTRLFNAAYGDQGFCLPAETYARSGGFPEIPLMEDVEFSRRLRALGSIELLPEPIWPSSRGMRARGLVRYLLRNRWIVWNYQWGADPAELWKRYYAGLPGRGDLPGRGGLPGPAAPPAPTRPHPFAGKFKRRGSAAHAPRRPGIGIMRRRHN